MTRIVQPSIQETAFNCPYCAAFTSQHWKVIFTKGIESKPPTPVLASPGYVNKMLARNKGLDESKTIELTTHWKKIESGEIVLGDAGPIFDARGVANLHLSACFNCRKIAVWVHDRLVHPATKLGPQANMDLPTEIAADFEEAREIVNASPRGAAALLRLCIQKLCKHLGEKGKTIDDDIASLVKKGLNPVIQKSLDIVRVGWTVHWLNARDVIRATNGPAAIVYKYFASIGTPTSLPRFFERTPQRPVDLLRCHVAAIYLGRDEMNYFLAHQYPELYKQMTEQPPGK